MPIESSDSRITRLPTVRLPDLHGALVDVNAMASDRPTVVAFVCNHCPYVQSIEQVLGHIASSNPDATWIAVCSNDTAAYPDDDVPGLIAQTQRAHWQFPYLVDADQQIARTFGAVCTPDFFVFDRTGNLVYRGAMDDARPRGPVPVDGEHLRSALDAARENRPYSGGKPSLGCGIKWLEH